MPLAWTLRFVRCFHAPVAAVLVATRRSTTTSRRSASERSCRGRAASISTPSPGPRDAARSREPICLYVGRVAIEKNIEAFLALDLPGSKWVVGDGPQLRLKRKYPGALLRLLGQRELASLYTPPMSSCSRAAPTRSAW